MIENEVMISTREIRDMLIKNFGESYREEIESIPGEDINDVVLDRMHDWFSDRE